MADFSTARAAKPRARATADDGVSSAGDRRRRQKRWMMRPPNVRGFEKKLEIIGVGWNANAQAPGKLTLNIGFCHPVEIPLPDGEETPRRWAESRESIRECNRVAGDPDNPDLVAFLGWEWTQVGDTPKDHYGHKNVILGHTEDELVPARPIGRELAATAASYSA